MPIKEAITDVAIGHREDAAHKANKTVLFNLFFLFLFFRCAFPRLGLGGPQEPRTEEEEHPREPINKRDTDNDEESTEDQRQDNACQ